MAAPLIAAVAGGAGNILSAGLNYVSQSSMNKRAEKFNREMYARQRADALSDWNMQNAYNDPAAQMARLKNAGLNPNLVYGNGATTEAGAPRASNVSTPDFKAPHIPDLGSIVMNAMSMRQVESNIARTDAETEAIKARTAGTEFQNQLNQAIGLDAMQKRYGWANDKLELEASKALHEYNAWIEGSFEGRASNDPNSPIAKAIKAGWNQRVQELQNAKALGDINRSESIIRDYKADLAKQGIPPDSPWYAKIVMDLVSKGLGVSPNSIGSFIGNLIK